MPRYIVQRSFPNGLRIPLDALGAAACAAVVENNGAEGVTWVHSYVSEDLTKTFCVYDRPDADAIRATARKNSMSVDNITSVRVLDPYFYKG